jgi:hypothetical protein
VAVALVAALVGALVVVAVNRGEPARAMATTVAAAPPEAAAAPSPTMVRLAVRTNPESATLVIDDKPEVIPYQAKHARGTRVRVSVRAPGFADYDRTVTLDEDTNLDIGLSRTAALPVKPAFAASPQGEPAKNAKKRMIEDGDPYRR